MAGCSTAHFRRLIWEHPPGVFVDCLRHLRQLSGPASGWIGADRQRFVKLSAWAIELSSWAGPGQGGQRWEQSEAGQLGFSAGQAPDKHPAFAGPKPAAKTSHALAGLLGASYFYERSSGPTPQGVSLQPSKPRNKGTTSRTWASHLFSIKPARFFERKAHGPAVPGAGPNCRRGSLRSSADAPGNPGSYRGMASRTDFGPPKFHWRSVWLPLATMVARTLHMDFVCRARTTKSKYVKGFFFFFLPLLLGPHSFFCSLGKLLWGGAIDTWRLAGYKD